MIGNDRWKLRPIRNWRFRWVREALLVHNSRVTTRRTRNDALRRKGYDEDFTPTHARFDTSMCMSLSETVFNEGA